MKKLQIKLQISILYPAELAADKVEKRADNCRKDDVTEQKPAPLSKSD